MVSIIITTYGEGTKVARAIKSVLRQTYKDIEIIVVDDNNPDTPARLATEKIMKQFAAIDQVIYIQHSYNKNGAAARNTGISVAKGEYLAFLDDDDIFLPNRVEKAVDFFKANQCAVGVLYGIIAVQNGKFIKIVKHMEEEQLTIPKILSDINNCLGTGSNMFVSAEAARIIQGFDERFYRFQDIEFMIRICEEGNVLYQSDIEIIKEGTGIGNLSYEKIEQAHELFSTKFKDYLSLYNINTRAEIESLAKRRKRTLWLEEIAPFLIDGVRHIRKCRSDRICKKKLRKDEYMYILQTWEYLNDLDSAVSLSNA